MKFLPPFMRQFVALLILSAMVLAGSSCCTLNRCISKHPELSMTVLEDSTQIIERTEYKDTIIYVSLPGDTIRDTIPPPLPWDSWSLVRDLQSMIDSLSDTISYLKGKRSRSIIALARDSTGYDRLIHELQEPDTTVGKEVSKFNRLTTIEKKRDKRSQSVREVKHIPGFYKFTFWWFWISLVLIILIVAMQFNFLKNLFRR